MNFYVNQSICIQLLKVGSVSNSSVLQIGSAGIIKPYSTLSNTGGFTEPAPEIEATPESPVAEPAVPLTGPTT